MKPSVRIFDLGLKPFTEVWDLQEKLRQNRLAGTIGDTVLLCEHPPVYTVGKQEATADFLASPSVIASEGIQVVACNRGGRITYHGPGQLVVYFIFRIENFAAGAREFVAKVEEVVIDLLQRAGLASSRKEGYPGIWVGDKKIVAIGLHISHGVSIHGLSLNVCPNLSHYQHIIPCGISEFGVTSLRNELGGKTPPIEEVQSLLSLSLSRVLAADCHPTEKVRSSVDSLERSAVSSRVGISSSWPFRSGNVLR